MFALPKLAFSAVTLSFKTRHQSAWRLELWRLFSLSRTIFKLHRPQPTDAKLLELSPRMQRYYERREDPAFRQKLAAMARLRYAKLRQQRQNDPEIEKSQRARRREDSEKLSDKQRSMIMFRLLMQRLSKSQRDAYHWKSHRPIVMSEPRLMTCDVCLTRTVGGKLWWERIDVQNACGTSGAPQYTCHSCYMDQDSDKILPRGLESYVLGSGQWFPRP